MLCKWNVYERKCLSEYNINKSVKCMCSTERKINFNVKKII